MPAPSARRRGASALVVAAVALGSMAARGARADRDADLAAVAAGQAARADTMIRTHVNRPFPAPAPDPGSPALGNASYALSALWLDTDAATANRMLVDVRDGAYPDEYWAMGELVRAFELFHCDSPFRPGRLTPEAEEACKDVLRRHLDLYSRLAEASEPDAWFIDGSENHDVMRRSVNLLGAEILAADRARADVPLSDGATLAEHRDAWSAYFVRYLQARASQGLFVERGSPTYAKYTLQSIFNLRDFASSRDVRELAARVIDLYFADASHELVAGVRGGAKSRSYHDRSSATGTSDSVRAYAHLLAGTPPTLPLTQHPSSLMAATSEHRLPRVILDLLANPDERGAFAYTVRPPGRGTRDVIPPPVDTLMYHASFPSDVLSTTLVRPEWVAGAACVDPSRTYMQIQSQNRWMGVVFRGATDSRVHAQCVALQSGNRTAYDEMTGLAEGDALVVQRLAGGSGGPLRVYFSSDLVREEAGGWVFARDDAGGGWVGVRPARGGFTWDPADPVYPGGSWMRPDDGDVPVIFQLGASADFGGDFAAFQARTQANALSWPTATELRYAPSSGREIAWRTDGVLPQVGGVTVDLAPPKGHDSPWLAWDHGALSGTVTSTSGYGSRTLTIDVARPPSGPGEIVLEAESGAIASPMAIESDVAASGRSFVHVPDGAGAGGSITLPFTIPSDGAWTLWARVHWLDGGANSLDESVDGEPNLVLGNGAAAPYWQWIRGATRRLSAGPHELVLSGREDGSRLDQVVLTTSGDDGPPLTVARAPSDVDGDGVPDAWLQAAFGHAAGLATDGSLASDDGDGDGETTLDEYLAGTDPRDAADALLIFVAKPGGAPAIRFRARSATGARCPPPERRHAVLEASAAAGPWATAAGLDDLGGTGDLEALLPPSGALSFYRVRPSIR